MQSSIFSDLQDRFSLQVSAAMQGDPKTEHGCYRLLAGRDEIYRLQGTLTSIYRQQVRLILGPEYCVPAIQQSQAQNVITQRNFSETSLKWTMDPKTEPATILTGEITTPERVETFRRFKAVCNLIGSSPNVLIR